MLGLFSDKFEAEALNLLLFQEKAEINRQYYPSMRAGPPG